MSKIKKIVISTFAAVMVALSACLGVFWGDIFRKTHEHSFVQVEQYDVNNHKKVCEYCDKFELEAHSFVDGVCKVCEYNFIVNNPEITYKQTTDVESLIDVIEALDSNNTSKAYIALQKDEINAGLNLKANKEREFIIDLGGHAYTTTTPVGSSGYESQSFHFEKGNKITIKNGTLKSNGQAKMLVQNYSDLTLENVILDGTTLDLNYNGCYTLSNNFGNITIKGNTQILARESQAAFDLWYGMSSDYDNGVKVEFDETFTGKVEGRVEYGAAGRASEGWEDKTVLAINGNGTFNIGQIVLTKPTEKPNIKIFSGTFDTDKNDSYRVEE